VDTAAIDSSGFDASHASTYFVKRREQTAKPQRLSCPTYPTLGIIADCRSHLILAALPGVGPWPEARIFPPLARQATRRVRMDTLLGDKAYDSEENHRFARERCKIKRTLIPIVDRQGRGQRPSGRYRRENKLRFRRKVYHQRWQVETVFSSLKRRFGSTLSSQTPLRRRHELLLKAVVLDLAIVRP
jgi:hypothetical protein